VTIVVEELSLGPSHSVVAVVGHPLAASGQFQMATDKGMGRRSGSPARTRRAYARSVEVAGAEMVRLPANASTMNPSAVSA
jgi:hypothetical protein